MAENLIERYLTDVGEVQGTRSNVPETSFYPALVGNVTDCAGYMTKVFPAIRKTLPLLLCSDNHNVGQYRTKCPMWIKADPSFLGLLQLLNEPQGRIYLGDSPHSNSRVMQNATKYMKEVHFERTESAKQGENWFSDRILLNHGLVAVIGNKGSGKSALADILALLGDTHVSAHFSFLNRERFLAPKTKLGSMFRGKVMWHSGREVSRLLSDSVDPTALELVKYIPQNYLETICSELKDSSASRFDKELMEVIFSHVSEAERLSTETLPDLISYLTNEKEERISQILLELAEVNETIVMLEDQHTEMYHKSIEAQLAQRYAELKSHTEAKPAEVKEPKQDPQAQEATKVITAELLELNRKADELEKSLGTERERLRIAALHIAAASKLLTRIENLERQLATFHTESSEDGKVLGLDVKQLVELKVDRQPIINARGKAEQQSRAAKGLLNAEVEHSQAAQRLKITAQLEAKRSQLDEPNRRYQKYLQLLAEWQKNVMRLRVRRKMQTLLRVLRQS